MKLSAGPEIVRYTITVDAGPGGTVSPGTTTVKEGSDVTFHITPNEGYVLDVLTISYLLKGASAKTVVTNTSATKRPK